jgi:mono/diheme cytochrome c family protein
VTSPRAILAALSAAAALLGCRATPPSAVERTVAAQVKRRLTVRGGAEKNPLADDPALVARGREAFARACAVCHGLDGQATGVPFAAAMAPPVPSLASPEVQAYTDGQLHWVIENGLWPSGMPAWKDLLHDEEIWRLVLYLRHLPPAGSLGEPAAWADPPAPCPAP